MGEVTLGQEFAARPRPQGAGVPTGSHTGVCSAVDVKTEPVGGGKFQARLSWVILPGSPHAGMVPDLKRPFAVILLLFSRNLVDLKMGLGGRAPFPTCAQGVQLCLNLRRRYLSQHSDESVPGLAGHTAVGEPGPISSFCTSCRG